MLKRNRTLCALIVFMVILATIFSNMPDDDSQIDIFLMRIKASWAFIAGTTLRISSGSPSPSYLLNSSTRLSILQYVSRNPGMHFRGICNGLGLPVGVAQYHLGLLSGAGFLTTHRDRRYKRYFVRGKYSPEEMEIIAAMRCGTAKEILRILLDEQSIRHSELASSMGVSSQTLTWQMKRLKTMNLIIPETKFRSVSYSINDEALPVISEFMEVM